MWMRVFWATATLGLAGGAACLLLLGHLGIRAPGSTAALYWERQGRESVDAVLLFGGLLSAGLWGGAFIHGVMREAARVLVRDRNSTRSS